MKSIRKKLVKKLDDLVREKVRERGKCEVCSSQKSLQVAHIYSRRHKGLRWDTDNLLLLCYACHMHFAHENPVEFTEWVKSYKGERKYNKLRVKARAITKFTEWELERLIKEYGH